jgi:sugar lactone lactonase YvrE
MGGALLAVALAALPGCTTRERLNPLDPRNARTGGSIPGFNAIAADSVVELRWSPLLQEGVTGYRVERWRPGGAPRAIGAADYSAAAIAAEDREVMNDTTYVYRLIAHLASGDSAVSPPDTATPGTRHVVALGAAGIAIAGFTPDLRDYLFGIQSNAPFLDMELDRKGGVLWMIADFITGGEVRRYLLNGTAIDNGAPLARPTDISVGGNRGIAWVASPDEQSVVAYAPSSPAPVAVIRVPALGRARVVEAGALDPSVWVGNEQGTVYRMSPVNGSILGTWTLGGTVLAIALDESDAAAWVAVRTGLRHHDLYRITEADSTARLVRRDLDNVADLAVHAATGDLWISERGDPRAGAGALRLVSRSGAERLAIGDLEPYGIDVDRTDGSCWVADLKSERILRFGRDGALLQASVPLDVPYAVRAHLP